MANHKTHAFGIADKTHGFAVADPPAGDRCREFIGLRSLYFLSPSLPHGRSARAPSLWPTG